MSNETETAPQQERAMEDRLRSDRDTVYLAELFEEVNKRLASRKKGAKEEAENLLLMYAQRDDGNYRLLRDYLQSVYHPAVKFDLPDEVPPFDSSTYALQEDAPMTLEMALRRVQWFVEGTSGYTVQKVKREHHFIQTLEALHAKDSKLYLGILLKEFPIDVYPKLNVNVFDSVFPEFFSSIDVDEISKREKELAKKPSTKKGTSSSKTK